MLVYRPINDRKDRSLREVTEMLSGRTTRGVFLALPLALGLGLAGQGQAADIESIHFLIPGGAGGGWDGTARGTGEALTKADIVGKASYENMSGGGGGKAIAHLIETAKKQQGTLMVNSTPIVIRSLQKVFPQSFRDLTPIAGTIGDYAASWSTRSPISRTSATWSPATRRIRRRWRSEAGRWPAAWTTSSRPWS
jgi:hypothetical protein